VRPILQLYVDRLPGALLEEKEFSLALALSPSGPRTASRRARELLDALAGLPATSMFKCWRGTGSGGPQHRGEQGGRGDRVAGGLGADFILAIGDDWTDEDLFRALLRRVFGAGGSGEHGRAVLPEQSHRSAAGAP